MKMSRQALAMSAAFRFFAGYSPRLEALIVFPEAFAGGYPKRAGLGARAVEERRTGLHHGYAHARHGTLHFPLIAKSKTCMFTLPSVNSTTAYSPGSSFSCGQIL